MPEDTGAMLDQINQELTDAIRERDEANERWKRALADFQNYQRRALSNEQEAKRQGVTAVLMSILPVLDHFEQALSPEASRGSAEQVMKGVTVIRGELLKALEAHGIRLIQPQPGAEFDPNAHQAISQMPAPGGDGGVAPGQILNTFQAGYALGDRIIRPAKVVVAVAPVSDR